MDIPQLAVGSSGVGDLNRWALVQLTRQGRLQRRERTENAQENLSKLLFGVDLNPDELRLYRAKLMEAISRVDALEEGFKLNLSGELAIPRSKVMLQVGNLAWLPHSKPTSSVEITPTHRLHSRNLARTLQTVYLQNPKSVHKSYHTVGIVVAQGGEGTRWGEDRVELTRWGLDVVSAKDYPKVARLRLPPRFPTQAEMVKFRVS